MRTTMVILTLVLTSSHVSAVELNLLDDCSLVDDLHNFVSRPVPPTNCRPPKSELEKKLLSVSTPYSCWFIETGSDKIDASYQCLGSDVQGTKFLDCYRFTTSAEIDAYKASYDDNYASDVAQYLDRTKQCARSPSGGLHMPTTAFYLPFVAVARFEFGFATVMGRSDAMTGSFTNAFAQVDPDLGADGEAIETLSLRVGPPQGLRRLEIDWASRDKSLVVNIDTLEELNEAWRQMSKSLAVPLAYSAFVAEFTTGFKKSTDTLKDEKRRAVFDKIDKSLGQTMERGGFSQIGDDDVESILKRSPEDLLNELRSLQPYGLRPSREDVLKVKVYFPKERGCEAVDGMTMIVLFQSENVSQQGTYGEVFAMMISGGTCVSADRRRGAKILKQMARDLVVTGGN